MMTNKLLNIFFGGRWDYFAHFIVNFTGVVCLTFFMPLWAGVLVLFVVFTAKEVVEYITRGYMGWMDLLYNGIGLVAGVLFYLIS